MTLAVVVDGVLRQYGKYGQARNAFSTRKESVAQLDRQVQELETYVLKFLKDQQLNGLSTYSDKMQLMPVCLGRRGRHSKGRGGGLPPSPPSTVHPQPLSP